MLHNFFLGLKTPKDLLQSSKSLVRHLEVVVSYWGRSIEMLEIVSDEANKKLSMNIGVCCTLRKRTGILNFTSEQFGWR